MQDRTKVVHGRSREGAEDKPRPKGALAPSTSSSPDMSSAPTPFTGLGPKVKSAYSNAVKSGAVLFTESEIEEADDAATGIPVRVGSFCTILAPS